MQRRTAAVWILVCTVLFAPANRSADAQGEASRAVQQTTDKSPSSEQAVESGQPAPSATTTTPVDYTNDLVRYLQRAIDENRTEIQHLKKLPRTSTARNKADNQQLSQQQFSALLAEFEQTKSELLQLKAGRAKNGPPAGQQSPQVLLDAPFLGMVYVPPNKNMRFFITRVVVNNSSAKPIVLKRKEFVLTADGKQHISETPSKYVKTASFQAGDKSYYLGNMQFPSDVTIPAGNHGSMWVVFQNMPVGGNVPAMSIAMQVAGARKSIDVNQFTHQMLGLSVERIGPRGSLGLLTISGAMNMINIGGMVDELDKLTTDKISRVVIRWQKSASAPDSQMANWLQQAANQAGRNQQNNNNRFPIVPASIHELHLANMPSLNNGETYGQPGGSVTPRIHKTDREAVLAALRSVYEVLSRDELLRETEEGHPLTRAAALEAGGGRLQTEDLPVILQFASGNHPNMQRAAYAALRHFGEPEAISALSSRAEKVKDPLAVVAIESLASSRYAAAHAELLKLLRGASPELKRTIVTIVARYPRPLWSDAVYEFAAAGDSQVRIVALQALVNIGHPQLIEVLTNSLNGPAGPIRDAAFNILVMRTDRQSEELALDYTLDYLEKSPPTSEMTQLLQRTREPRAVPLLLKHFEKSKSSRSTLVRTLALIGDQSVADVLLKQYQSLNTSEKSVVLNMLRQFRSPRFRELAGEALLSDNSSLVSAACQGLQEDGSPQAVQFLVKAFEKSKQSYSWSYISNALAALGTPEARAALKKGTQSKDSNRRTYSINALRNMRQRSPGYQYIYRAQQFDRQKKWKEAVQQYTLAAQFDPNLPDAFSGRGNAYLKLEKFKEAGLDFEKALNLDEFNTVSLTGLGIVRVMQGKADEGIQLVEGKRKQFENDPLFAYNTACVYGRALEAIKKEKESAAREKKVTLYQKKALEDLRRSLKLGFRDLNWMKQDPDLKSLHDLDEFKKIQSGEDAANNNARAVLPGGIPARGIRVRRVIRAVPPQVLP